MRKPRIKRVYLPNFGEWVWGCSCESPGGWHMPSWQERRAQEEAAAFCAKLNQRQIYERHIGRQLEE